MPWASVVLTAVWRVHGPQELNELRSSHSAILPRTQLPQSFQSSPGAPPELTQSLPGPPRACQSPQSSPTAPPELSPMVPQLFPGSPTAPPRLFHAVLPHEANSFQEKPLTHARSTTSVAGGWATSRRNPSSPPHCTRCPGLLRSVSAQSIRIDLSFGLAANEPERTFATPPIRN